MQVKKALATVASLVAVLVLGVAVLGGPTRLAETAQVDPAASSPSTWDLPEVTWPADPSQDQWPPARQWPPELPSPWDWQPPDTNSGSAGTTQADAAESTGLALISTDISFGMGAAAGTGMVIDSDGIVVTNHHVVVRSTAVWVTIPATEQTYQADVLGYDPATDVAVLQLADAQGLSTVVADTAQLSVGQTVTSVGNAQGGGALVSATGEVTGLGQNITVTGDDGSQSDLFDLIAVNADMVPGDSGGALLDADGEVVGMNVAGSKDPADDVGYAIPINTVLDIASDVLAGRDTGTITLGRTGALGVTVSTISQDLVIVGVVDDGPADQVGMSVGSRLTVVDSQPVATRADLAAILAAHRPGDQVQVAWTDEAGAPHEATVTLTTAPLA